MKFSLWSRAVLLFVAGTLMVSSPAEAQFTKSWKFLQSVREKNGEEVLDALGGSDSNIINTHDSSNGQTALHIVTARRDVDEPSSTGETPLIAAVHRRDLAMMRVLLTAGANPDRADNSGRSARDYALLGGKNNMVSALIDELAKTSGDHAAGSYGPTL